MSMFDRVHVDTDANWSTEFIPWIEALERNGTGLRDGFFVATFDPSIRCVRPDTEQDFLHFLFTSGDLCCVDLHIFARSLEDGLYEMHKGSSALPQKQLLEKFTQDRSPYASYTHDTCCSQLLSECDGLEKLFKHWETDALMHGSLANVSSKVTFRNRVKAAQAVYNGFKGDTSDFKWEQNMKTPPRLCEDLECVGPNLGTDRSVLYGFGQDAPSSRISVTKNLRLSRIFNLLWALDYHYPGVQTSFRYYASTHSSFAVHCEDGLFYSCNYLYIGHPKIWVIVPPSSTALLEFHLRRGSHMPEANCTNLLSHKRHLPTTQWLTSRKIKFKIVIQKPGDMVILRPNTAHYGFATGPSISEAVNFLTESALPYALNARRCRCLLGEPVHINIAHLIAAFRPDLHRVQRSGKLILNHDMHIELQLTCAAICESAYIATTTDRSSHSDGVEAAELYGCPAPACGQKFRKLPHTRRAMRRHVRLAHNPHLESGCLLQKIDELLADPK